MQSVLLVANPASSGFSRSLHRRVAATLDKTLDVHAAWPSSAEHARELSGKAVADGIDIVAAMGGDGIVHHVAQALVGTGTPLGVIPCGTANVVARQLNIPLRAVPAAKLVAHQPRLLEIPVLEVSVVTTSGPLGRHALFSLGVGADADIVKAAESNPLRKRDFGPLHYVTTAIAQVRRDIGHRTAELRIDAGEHSTVAIGAMAQFRSSYTYFGRLPMRLSPRDPSPITLLIVEQLRVRRAVSMIRATMGRTGLESVRGFDIWSGVEQFHVESGHPTTMQADGEVIGGVLSLDARHRPEGLRIAVPRSTGRGSHRSRRHVVEIEHHELEFGESGGDIGPPAQDLP